MINLLPWRENLLIRKKRRAITLVIMSYLVCFSVAGIVFFTAIHKEDKLRQTLVQLTQAANQAHINAQGLLEQQTLSQHDAAARAMVWQRYRMIEKIIQLIMHIPDAVILNKLHCMPTSCDLELGINNPTLAKTLFASYQVHDIKPGDCSLCYQVTVTAAL